MVSALVEWLEYLYDSSLRGSGFNTRESQTLFRRLDGCIDYSTHDMYDLKKTIKSLMVRRKINKLN